MRADAVTEGFDYRDDAINIKRYGSATVPVINMDSLGDLKVPVSLFVGKHDLLSTIKDDRDIRDKLGSSLHQYHEIEADHLSLLIGKDMSYFTINVLEILREQHPPTQ